MLVSPDLKFGSHCGQARRSAQGTLTVSNVGSVF